VLLDTKIDALYRVAHARENAHPAMIEALMADATIAEVWGTVRVASGLPYDPFRVLDSPFATPRV
jgi:methylmalonyl-CoA mutase N-terminal domain/subunit